MSLKIHYYNLKREYGLKEFILMLIILSKIISYD